MDIQPKVAIVRCESYRTDCVAAAVRRGISLIGGINRFVEAGEKILLKPNALLATHPERCVVTHPAVFGAVAAQVLAAGGRAVYGDSPGGVLPAAYTLKRCGFAAVAQALGVEQAEFDRGQAVPFASGTSSKLLFIARGVLEADGVISLPKLKTHGLTTLTCAIKNQFGCVPGMMKGEYHARFPDVYDFSRFLADITACIRPRLYILDAVWAMEGNGPQNGDPVQLGTLLFSADPVAIETVACRIVDIDPSFVPTIEAGQAAGLGDGRIESIELVGDRLDDCIRKNFRARRKRPPRVTHGPFLTIARRYFSVRPIIRRAKCSRCGKCVEMCPVDPKAVRWPEIVSAPSGSMDQSPKGNPRVLRRPDRPPRYDYRLCIRCFCCHEMCPSGAIVIKTPLPRRLLPFGSYLGLLASRIANRLHEKNGPGRE